MIQDKFIEVDMEEITGMKIIKDVTLHFPKDCLPNEIEKETDQIQQMYNMEKE